MKGKETAIGLVAITLLLGTFGYVLYNRHKTEAATAKAEAAKMEASGKPGKAAAERPSIAAVMAAPEPQSAQHSNLVGDRHQSLPSRAPRPASQPLPPTDRYADRHNLAGDGAVGNVAAAGDQQPVTTSAPANPFQRSVVPPDTAALPVDAAQEGEFPPDASSSTLVPVEPPARVAEPRDNPLRGSRTVTESAASSSAAFRPRRYDLDAPAATEQAEREPLAPLLPEVAQAPPAKDRQGAAQFGPASNRGNDGIASDLPQDSELYIGPRSHRANDASSSAGPVPVNARRTLPLESTARRTAETHIVEPNDSFWVISEKVYGSGHYFKALQEHNKHSYPRPNLLQPGDIVSTPSADTLLKRYPEFCPKPHKVQQAQRAAGTLSSQRQAHNGRTYVVEAGDTLFDIARYELGKAARWAEIYELNREVIGADMNHLSPGLVLILPNDHPPDAVTRRPGSPMQR